MATSCGRSWRNGTPGRVSRRAASQTRPRLAVHAPRLVGGAGDARLVAFSRVHVGWGILVPVPRPGGLSDQGAGDQVLLAGRRARPLAELGGPIRGVAVRDSAGGAGGAAGRIPLARVGSAARADLGQDTRSGRGAPPLA